MGSLFSLSLDIYTLGRTALVALFYTIETRKSGALAAIIGQKAARHSIHWYV
jgi:hypothetical protein